MRHTPFHEGSETVVKILEAARLQNKYWDALEAAFDSQNQWAIHHVADAEKLWKHLANRGLDINKLKTDMHSEAIARRIAQDMADARELKVTKTPGFFVNGKPLIQFGYKPLQELIKQEYLKYY